VYRVARGEKQVGGFEITVDQRAVLRPSLVPAMGDGVMLEVSRAASQEAGGTSRVGHPAGRVDMRASPVNAMRGFVAQIRLSPLDAGCFLSRQEGDLEPGWNVQEAAEWAGGGSQSTAELYHARP
jgi:hypothetical protein